MCGGGDGGGGDGGVCAVVVVMVVMWAAWGGGAVATVRIGDVMVFISILGSQMNLRLAERRKPTEINM